MPSAGTHRQLAGQLQIPGNRCGTILLKEAREVTASSNDQIREDKSVRNVAFSILLSALAVLQIAVVTAALSDPPVQIASAGSDGFGARQAVASTETGREVSAL